MVSSAVDASIQKKVFGSGTMALVISNKEMEALMKIIASLENSGVWLKKVSKTVKEEVKK